MHQLAVWQLPPPQLEPDAAFNTAVIEVHWRLFQLYFNNDPQVNADLGIVIRASRRLEAWRVLLLLTPWMLARILAPIIDPGLPLPADWSAETRRGKPYQVLGPRLVFSLLGQSQPAHLNYHPDLGHYLLQPIVLDMLPYSNPEAVFAAWHSVIRTRDANMDKHRKDCPWQRELSRRELFTQRPHLD